MELTAFSDLLDLQEVDLEIDRLLHQRSSLPELQDYRDVNGRKVSAETARGEVDARVRVLALELDKAEGELEMVEAKLKEAETRLYAGGMSGKETEYKRLEVQSLRGQQEAMESRVLGLLDQKDAVDSELAAATAIVDDLAGKEGALSGVIASRWKEIDAVLARKEDRKRELVPPIVPDLLEIYETLRRTKEGVAISRLHDGQCGGCHLQLSAAEQVEAGRSDPPRCVHCRRLIVL